MSCMRHASLQELQRAAGDPDEANHVLDCLTGLNCTSFKPVIDGSVLPVDYLPALLNATPSLPSAVPMIYGHNPQDAMLFFVGEDDGTTSPDISHVRNYEAYVLDAMATLGHLHDYPNAARAALPKVLAAYPADARNGTKNREMLGRLATDLEFVCGAAALAAALERLPAGPLPSWRYLFDYNSSFSAPCDLNWPAAYGVPHTAELSYFWGTPIYPFGKPDVTCRFTSAEARFAEDIGASVRELAEGRSPSATWKQWGSDNAHDVERVLHPGAGGAYKMEASGRSAQCEMWIEIWRTRDDAEAQGRVV